jgi:hypothetical protein
MILIFFSTQYLVHSPLNEPRTPSNSRSVQNEVSRTMELPSPWYLLVAIPLSLVLFLSRVLKNKTGSSGVQLPKSGNIGPGEPTWESRSNADMSRCEKGLSEFEQFNKLLRCSNIIQMYDTSGLWTEQPRITSGQLAAMVQRRHEQIDVERNDIYQDPRPWMLLPSCPSTSPSSNDRNDTVMGPALFEVHDDSNPHSIWRRKILEFVGR